MTLGILPVVLIAVATLALGIVGIFGNHFGEHYKGNLTKTQADYQLCLIWG